jgi:predicted DNA-binding protein (MmcQ/YjbR family)
LNNDVPAANQDIVPESPAESLFNRLAAEQARQDVEFGRVWHNDGLKVGGKVFAMVVRGRLVVKIPRERAAAMTESGLAVPFEPRPGRRMREWVCLEHTGSAEQPEEWRRLIDEAREYVAQIAT